MSRVFVVLFALALLAPTPTQSQETLKAQMPSSCSLTPAQAPAIRGLKLGMSSEEILALFPESNQRPEIKAALANAESYPSFGVAHLYFQPSMYPAAWKDRFAGIDGIAVTLFDDHMSELQVSYAGQNSNPRGPFWPDVDRFIAKLSEAYRLPAARDWHQVGEAYKVLDCNGLNIEARTPGGTGAISLRSTKYLDKSRERAAEMEEKIRKEFRP